MKFASTLFFALFAAAEANNLRAVRRLEDGSDAEEPVNNAVGRTIDVINTAVEKALPESVEVGQSQTQTFTVSSGSCSGSEVTGTFTIDEFTGVNSLQYESMELIVNGNEEYSGDCLNVQGQFSGNFSYVLKASSLSATGSIDVSGGTCDDYTSTVDTTITNLEYTGISYLEGRIGFGVAVITEIEIYTMEGTCDSVETTFGTPVPDQYADIEAEVSTKSNDEMKAYLADDLATFITDEINNLDAIEADLGLAGGVPYIAALFQAGIQKRINGMVGATQAQINAINANANKQIAQMTARVNNGVDGAEKAVSGGANGLAAGITEKLNSWGTATENFIGKWGFNVDP